MEYIYASMLLHSARKPITEESIKNILKAADIEADDIKVKALVAALKEVNIDDIIKSATLSVAAPVVTQATTEATTRVEEKKEEKEEKKEEVEETMAEGLGALFG
ncbi:MAG: 50S ribosomal protein P1 [Candidatus Methanomethylicia archaeon]